MRLAAAISALSVANVGGHASFAVDDFAPDPGFRQRRDYVSVYVEPKGQPGRIYKLSKGGAETLAHELIAAIPSAGGVETMREALTKIGQIVGDPRLDNEHRVCRIRHILQDVGAA